MVLSQDQVDAFRRDGYLKYGKILEDEQIELLREQYDLEFERARGNNDFRNLSASDGQDVATEKQMLQIMQMCERNIHFRRLLYNEKILDIVQDIIGPNIQLFHDQALFKPALDGGPVTWHQDNSYWQCHPANLVSCWLTLDDVDIHNGAMQVIPGSHLAPVNHARNPEFSALKKVEGIDESKIVVNELPAGGCMFHHCQTLHYTAPNATDRQRRALAIHFMAPGTQSGAQSHAETMVVSFSRPMLRATAN